MRRTLRTSVTEQEYQDLQICITHFGQISYILRQAVKKFISENKPTMQEVKQIITEGDHHGASSSKGRGTTKTKAYTNR